MTVLSSNAVASMLFAAALALESWLPAVPACLILAAYLANGKQLKLVVSR